MNRTLLHLLILSLVWLSADAAADSGTLGHAHQEAAIEMGDAEETAGSEADDQRHQDKNGHCERCCHAHASVLPTLTLAPDTVPPCHFPKPANVARQASDPPPPVPPPIA